MTATENSAPEASGDSDRWDPRAMEARWLPVWDELAVFRSGSPDDTRPRRYLLDMLPYPSGDLHMGHAEAYALGDVIARYWTQLGWNVLHPIGWDAFGLPAENAAIKRGLDPREWTYANIAQQRASLRRYACSFDWDRVVVTSDPSYYRWNQWLFSRMHERGIAYRRPSEVNWCPDDQTVLANEQVVDGRCERCGAVVTKRRLTQWYLRVTDYAERLLDDMDQLEGRWPERVLTMQRNWIGRSTGADVDFVIEGRAVPVTVFTTRADTLFGVTFLVVAPESDLAVDLVADAAPEVRAAFEAYATQVRSTTEIDRLSTEHPKTGVFLGRYAINPLTGDRLPVWAADYVLADYGHGAIMAVPAHDQRDLDFARAHDLPIRTVIAARDTNGALLPDPVESGVAATGDGTLVGSGPLDGLGTSDAIARAVALLEGAGTGRAAVTYRLRDWLISRQRYWGTPIPIIHCEVCGEVRVPDDELPVELPPSTGLDLTPKGTSPLGGATDWVAVDCPSCGRPARRDTDTMDTFVDSSWYFLRYLSPHHSEAPFDPSEAERWMPVDQYVGGITHAILHLLYARFWMKVLHDLGLVTADEPFAGLLNQGMVLMDGSAMSKSRGNLVRLADQLDTHGVDAVRLTMCFAGPPEADIDWADVSPGAATRFLARAWRLAGDVSSDPGVDPENGDQALRRVTHRTITQMSELLEAFRVNVAVARLMELVTAARRAIDSGPGGGDPAVREAVETVAILLSLFAPYTAEDMWARLGHQPSVARAGLPTVDPDLLAEDTVTCVVQVDGKVRDRLQVAPGIAEAELRDLALSTEGVRRSLDGRTIRTVIVRAPGVVNVVPTRDA